MPRERRWAVQSQASTGIWYVIADDLPLSGLDARYLGAIASKTAVTGSRGSNAALASLLTALAAYGWITDSTS